MAGRTHGQGVKGNTETGMTMLEEGLDMRSESVLMSQPD